MQRLMPDGLVDHLRCLRRHLQLTVTSAYFFTTLSSVSQQPHLGYTEQNGNGVQMMGVSSPQGSEPWAAQQKHVPLTLHNVELQAHVGPQQPQHGSGASPMAQQILPSRQHVMPSPAQPSFGGNSSARLAQQIPATTTDLEQQPMAPAGSSGINAGCRAKPD
eukprot:CAMPEP_0204529716 /NCGR_PEP_ID=MMETSP0661-20131031/10218_1 /ASSEMBLY_ACC=CAM_ASM_000606 /TAXON_ID=109239 /ORGANISM="Alexandrium margalefi, Strain AMGDE01CS-322" /LENGTH=161 /DNA_ID=CAMNT_0051535753 /DNA_START=260 /DNA_END=743 /DNA_ORIENTATION=+